MNETIALPMFRLSYVFLKSGGIVATQLAC